MGILKDIGLVSAENQSSQTFEDLFGKIPFFDVEYDKPSSYVDKYWEAFNQKAVSNNSLLGKFFELVIETLFLREGLMPLFSQAKVAFVPNVDFDIILYKITDMQERIPISISVKTSLRERYKQADLEGFALKNVHRKAKCYLLTMDAAEASRVNRKILAGDVAGLDRVFVCNTEEFDEFIYSLKENMYVESDVRTVITSNCEVTEDTYNDVIKSFHKV